MIRRRFSPTLEKLLPTIDSKNKKSDKSPRKLLAATLFPSPNLKSRASSIRRSVTGQENYESIVFVWLDSHEALSSKTVSLLRLINDSVRVYTNSSLCLAAIQSCREKVFFIMTSADNDLIATVHDIPAVEAIFVFDPNAENLKSSLPKFCGIFAHQEELFRELKETLDIFEQTQLEFFVYEEDNIFLYRQLWRDDLAKRKGSSNKQDFIEAVRIYYQNNVRTISIIDEFEKSYRAMDVLNWCSRSPFPARLLKHAVGFQHREQMNLCRFLFADTIRSFQKQSERKFYSQVYRGMKLSDEQIGQFEKHVGQLICTSGFFPCTRSRADAMALASFATYRPDLSAVLFKIDCKSADLFIEISNAVSSSSTILFDLCMAFRIVGISHGQLTVIRLKTAGEDGKRIVQDYLAKHSNEQMESLLDQFLPVTEVLSSSLTPPVSTGPKPLLVRKNSRPIGTDELEAKKYTEQGEIDRALIAYRRIQPASARILNIIGQLSAKKKGDYEYAFQCYSRALQMQEQDGEDVSETLTNLGNVHHYRRELDTALGCHQSALALREKADPPDCAPIAVSLMGIAKTQWLRQEYEKAITSAERALTLRETLVPANEMEIGRTLVLLGNIYYDCGKHEQALTQSLRALPIIERTKPVDLYLLAELLNSLGNIHGDLGAMEAALPYLERSVEIYAQLLPRGHPDRVSAEMDLEHAHQCKQKNEKNLDTHV